MGMVETQDYSIGNKVIGGEVFTDQVPLGADTYYQGMPLQYTAVGAVTANVGNTGNGTVTAVLADKSVPAGSYNLEVVEEDGTFTSALGMVAGGGNTGNGVPGAVTLGDVVQEGVYTLVCVDVTVPGSEVFSVTTPNGEKLEDLTVAVAYTTEHFSVTLADGLANFIAGDTFSLTVDAQHGAVLKLVAPNGEVFDDNIKLPGTALGSLAYVGNGFSFTITDGPVDFVVSDKFAIVVASTGSFVYTTNYSALGGIYNGEDAKILAAPGYGTIIVFGEIREDGIVNDAGVAITITEDMRQLFAKAGFYIKRM